MSLVGKQEISDEISVKSYFTTLLIGTLPLIGDILLVKWGNSKEVRKNKQNMCKAYFRLKLVLLYPIVLMLIAFMYIAQQL